MNPSSAQTALRRPTRNQRAFTLIELLVVVAIISLLVSILIPSLTKAKDLAKVTACASNLHHIGMGCFIYANDFQGVLPLNHNYMGNFNHVAWYNAGEIPGWQNFGLLYGQRIIEAPQMLYCPSFEGASPGVNEDTPPYDQMAGEWDKNPPEAGIVRIPYTYLIPHKPGILDAQGANGFHFDGAEGDYKFWAATADQIGNLPIGCDLLYNIQSWTHYKMEKFNVLFGDGHVSFLENPTLACSATNWPGFWSGGTFNLHYAFHAFSVE